MVSVIDMSKKKFASEIADATKIDGPQLGCVSRHSVPLLQMELIFLKWLHKSVHGSSGVLKRRKLTRTYETVLFLSFFFLHAEHLTAQDVIRPMSLGVTIPG